MRKQTKLVAVLSAAALLAIGASMTSFAKAGWALDGDEWVWLDGNGDRVTNEWKKSADGNYYWLDEDGNKLQTLSPELIDLHLVNLDTDWLEDTAINEVTRERTVLYYNKLLLSGEETPLFADSLTIDDSIAKKVSEQKVTEGGRTTITTTYDYDGVQFQIEVEVDAVQEHNAEDAVWSVWGRRVKVENNTLSLQ